MLTIKWSWKMTGRRKHWLTSLTKENQRQTRQQQTTKEHTANIVKFSSMQDHIFVNTSGHFAQLRKFCDIEKWQFISSSNTTTYSIVRQQIALAHLTCSQTLLPYLHNKHANVLYIPPVQFSFWAEWLVEDYESVRVLSFFLFLVWVEVGVPETDQHCHMCAVPHQAPWERKGEKEKTVLTPSSTHH